MNNQYESLFLEQYSALNDSQKKAVDTIEGPVMVIAGPGTGKTQVLSLRVAQILRMTDTTADAILCLTFTNAGVRAMRERFARYIGGQAAMVRVTTFHSFAMSILSEFYAELGYSAPLEQIQDVEAFAVLDELLANSAHSDVLKEEASSTRFFNHLSIVRDILTNVDKAGVTIDQAIERTRAEIVSLEQDPESISKSGITKGGIKKPILEKIANLQKSIIWFEFAGIYRQELARRGKFEQGELLRALVYAVNEHTDIRDAIRERFLYVLVDEHQDSSNEQNDFLYSVWGDVESPNLFVVGDDRQIIYSFNGSSISQFASFEERLQAVTKITLTTNYRSTTRIVESADRLLKSKLAQVALKAHNPATDPLTVVETTYEVDQYIYIAQQILSLHASGVPYHEISVLVPQNVMIPQIRQALAGVSIPSVGSKPASLLSSREAQGIFTLLQVWDSPHDSVAVSRLLVSPLCPLPFSVVQDYFAECRTSGVKVSLSGFRAYGASLSFVSSDVGDAIVAYVDGLFATFQECTTYDLAMAIQVIAKRWVLLFASVSHSILLERVEVVRTYTEYARSCVLRDPTMRIGDFIAYLERIQQRNIAVPIMEIELSDAVRIQTLHGSKGLEYEYVFIAQVSEKYFSKKHRSPSFFPQWLKDMFNEKDTEEFRKLLYVGITRAKKHCTLSYSYMDVDGKVLVPSPFILEVQDADTILVTRDQVNAFMLERGLHAFAGYADVVSIESDVAHIVASHAREVFQKRPLAVTQLNSFLACPWKWYFRSVMALPEPQLPHLLFGTIVHVLVQSGYAQTYDWTLREHIEQEASAQIKKIYPLATAKEHASYVARAVAVVISFRDVYARDFSRYKVAIEKSITIHNHLLSPVPLRGAIDMYLNSSDQGIRVVDLKTGKAKKLGDITRRPDDRMSDLLLQLSMYALLVRETEHQPLSSIHTELIFLENAGGPLSVSMAITQEHIDELLALIKDMHSAVMDGTWVHRPCTNTNHGPCEYCPIAQSMHM